MTEPNSVWPIINSIGLLILSIGLTFLSTRYFHRRTEVRIAEEARERTEKLMSARIEELERRLGEVGSTVQPLSAAFQAMLIKQLTHFHTPVLDALLVKLGPPVTLTDEEREQMTMLLEERSRDVGAQIDELERHAAHILPYVVKMVTIEQTTDTSHDPIELVTVPEAPEAKDVTEAPPEKQE